MAILSSPPRGGRAERGGWRASPWRLAFYGAIGIAAFFLPVPMDGKVSIPVDHAVTLVREHLSVLLPPAFLALMAYGAIREARRGAWRRGVLAALPLVLSVAGLAVGALAVVGALPGPLAREDLVPFLIDKLVVPVGLIVPIGSAALAFLLSFGLMELLGVLAQPVMRPLWRTPGRSAVDAATSFVGSYSLGLLVTDRVYRNGGYTKREAAIIATGFSTVSAAFMVVVARSLGLMGHWALYFVTTLIVTFAVTAITARIPPLSRIPDETCPGATPEPERRPEGSLIKAAWASARETLKTAPPLHRAIGQNLLAGVRMSAAITPSILSVGLAALLLATYTPAFAWLGLLFAPLAWLVGLPDPAGTGEALALSIAEMLLPATQVGDQADPVTAFVVGVTSVSAIVFFSALVPCILATRIPVSVPQLVAVWAERVALTVLIAGPLAQGFAALGWLG